MALIGVWDPNKVYYGFWVIEPGDPNYPEYPDGLMNPNGSADEVMYMGAVWRAQFWNISANPLMNNPGDGDEWVLVSGTVNYALIAPEAPTELEVTRTSADSVALFWNTAEVKGAGGVTHYNIFVNGEKVGVSDSTSFLIKGLNANTQYEFSVTAVNFMGASDPSTSVLGFTNTEEILSGKTYSPYVDMTLPHVDLLDLARESGVKDFTLSFMQSNRAYLDSETGDYIDGTVPSLEWGGISNTTLPTGVIAHQVEQIQKLGGTVTVAFGGYTGREAAVIARQYAEYLDTLPGKSTAQAMEEAITNLTANYQSVIDTYGTTYLDFDIENAAYKYDDPFGENMYDVVNDTVANHMRNVAINRLEEDNGDVHISFTLPVTVNGFRTNPSDAGGDVLRVLEQAVADGVDVDVVNIMAMDYFDGDPDDMGQKAIDAAVAVRAQLLAIGLDAKIGIVPMIGVNDNLSEVFTLEDAQQVLDFAMATDWIANIGIWQLPRDRPSDLTGPNGTLPPISTGSGISDQDPWEFSDLFNKITRLATSGADKITGNESANSLRGLAGNDTIKSNGGNDIVQGGLGADDLDGGVGFDILDYTDKSTKVDLTLNGATQINVKLNNVNEDKAKNFEGAHGGSADDNLIGDGANNTFRGNGGNDTIDGAAGTDTADFSDKKVRVQVTLNTSTSATVLVNGVAEDAIKNIENINGGVSSDILIGDLLANGFVGNAGNDHVRGMAGVDNIDGGVGLDTADYSDKTLKVEVALNAATGVWVKVNNVNEDGIKNVENIIGGSAGDKLTGDSLANLFRGNGGIDTLDGGAGLDTADFAEKTTKVAVTLNGATAVTVKVNNVNEDSIKNIENVYGGTAGDELTGDTLANLFRGNAGIDTINGGAGGDTADYAEKTAKVEVALNGATAVRVKVNNVDEDFIKNIEHVSGGSAGDKLTGDGLANILIGNAGDDTLKGGVGADTLDGGAGARDFADYSEKTTAVDVTLNGATEVAVKVNGVVEDRIKNIEDVTTGSGNDRLFGDSLANKLTGGSGNDTIGGDGGADTLDGGVGTRDVLDYTDKTVSVVATLSGATETTVTVGGASEDRIKNFEDIIGGTAADHLTGDAGINFFTGGRGNDTINGGGGADHFRFTASPTSTNMDTIDFKHDEDFIDLDDGIFGALGAGVTDDEIRIVTSGNAAADSNDRLIYNKTTGALFFDANANGTGGAIQIALLTNKPVLIDAGDFAIV